MKTFSVAAAVLLAGLGLVPAAAQAATGGNTVTSAATVSADGRLSWYDGAVQLVPAAPSAWTCDDGYLCLYDKTGGRGKRLQFRDHYCQNLTDYSFNDQVDSYWDRNSRGFWWYYAISCRTSGGGKWISAGARNSDMGADNNQMSSIGGG